MHLAFKYVKGRDKALKLYNSLIRAGREAYITYLPDQSISFAFINSPMDYSANYNNLPLSFFDHDCKSSPNSSCACEEYE